MLKNEEIWHDCLESIKVSVSPANFSTWFSQTHLINIDKKDKRYLVEVGCASAYIKATIESRYFGLIQDSLSKTLEAPCDLVFSVKSTLNKDASKKISKAPLFEKEESNKESLTYSFKKSGIRRRFTFENFAVSSSNQMAWAAAEAVCEKPGDAYNPLFIWGGVGVGKTHLMNAVGYNIIKNKDDALLLFCTGEQFTNDIVEGIRKKTTQAFREKYRKLDVLFLDDVQFIAGKDAVQEEFFHTFNALVSDGKQIILTSDRPPSVISKLEERLRSRFEAGLIVDISPPDFELRCAIIQIKAKEKGIELDTDSVHLIAGNINAAREIEGFLTKLYSQTLIKHQDIDEETVRSLIGKPDKDVVVKIKANPDDVIGVVSKYYSIGKRQLLGKSRARPVSQPRQVLMYILRTDLQLPLQEVGRITGGRDHTTVMHAVDKITKLASKDVQTREDIMGIKNML